MRALSFLALTATAGLVLWPSIQAKKRRASFGLAPGRGFSMSSGGGESHPGPSNPCARLARLLDEQGSPDAEDFYLLAESPTPAVLDECVREIARMDVSAKERASMLVDSRRKRRRGDS